MGGYFSTRWNLAHVRPDTDPLLSLDVRWLGRIGALAPGAVSTPQWRRHGEPAGWITTIRVVDGGSLILDYATRTEGSIWVPVREAIGLTTTPCHYGGERTWFLCPGCHTRRAVLFSVEGQFRCRSCHDLAYTSTREDSHSRAIRRCAELRCKLGGGFGQPMWTIPPKPDGMTHRRYWRIVKLLTREINRASGIGDARLDALSSGIDSLLAEQEHVRRRSGI